MPNRPPRGNCQSAIAELGRIRRIGQSAIRNSQFAICALVVFLLAGCAIGPNYHRPATEVPQQFNSTSDPGATNSLADLPWWEIFNDATLTNLIQIALTNNYDIAIAAARVEQARALAVQARSSSSRRPATMSTDTAE